jgi:histidinol-phosphate aminotransferase
MSIDMTARAMSGPLSIQPYQPGKPVETLARERALDPDSILKLASNENPLGPSPGALEAVRLALSGIHFYPDGNAFALKQALSEKLGVHTGQLVIGNGSNDVLELVARAFLGPDTEAVMSAHAFAVYPLATLGCSARPVITPARHWGHDLEAMAAAITPKTRLVFIANPNNPTGTWLTDSQIRDFMGRVPEDLVVVYDEAYFEYVQEADYPDGAQLLSEYPNMVVTRTFSKIHALAGLRIGYGIMSPALADLLNRVRQPFNANSLALAAAVAALEDDGHVQKSVRLNNAGLGQLSKGLGGLGLEWIPSVGNFISFRVNNADAVYGRLLDAGVIVRPVDAYAMPGFLRVTVGTETENERFLSALGQVL